MTFSTIDEVIHYLRTNKGEFQERYGITSIGIFGSFVRKEQNPFSDIDMVVEMDPHRKNLHNFLQFKRHVERTLELSVDIGFEHTLKPAARESVKKQIVYA
ncbi:nucleotidyltransferase family protein [Desulfonatronovibrio magnus]|uniref:nucleotidyltransferase family protein n=1 Tax=Desulfonatronovibrio magnus TaxID=698827 RepID=UPI0005EB433B|nr:nucleotidyltransferase domain-containing protein [Desulfonatronovibrio magnus]